MSDAKTAEKKFNRTLWMGLSLLGMLLAPPLLLYPGAQGHKPGLVVIGYIILVISMLIPALMPKKK